MGAFAIIEGTSSYAALRDINDLGFAVAAGKAFAATGKKSLPATEAANSISAHDARYCSC